MPIVYAVRAVSPEAVSVTKADGTRYTVTLDTEGLPIACGCVGFHYRGACRHLHMVGRLLETGGLVAVPVETIACDVCGEPTDPACAESWPMRDGGRRPVCVSCVDDLLLHAVPGR